MTQMLPSQLLKISILRSWEKWKLEWITSRNSASTSLCGSPSPACMRSLYWLFDCCTCTCLIWFMSFIKCNATDCASSGLARLDLFLLSYLQKLDLRTAGTNPLCSLTLFLSPRVSLLRETLGANAFQEEKTFLNIKSRSQSNDLIDIRNYFYRDIDDLTAFITHHMEMLLTVTVKIIHTNLT